ANASFIIQRNYADALTFNSISSGGWSQPLYVPAFGSYLHGGFYVDSANQYNPAVAQAYHPWGWWQDTYLGTEGATYFPGFLTFNTLGYALFSTSPPRVNVWSVENNNGGIGDVAFHQWDIVLGRDYRGKGSSAVFSSLGGSSANSGFRFCAGNVAGCFQR